MMNKLNPPRDILLIIFMLFILIFWTFEVPAFALASIKGDIVFQSSFDSGLEEWDLIDEHNNDIMYKISNEGGIQGDSKLDVISTGAFWSIGTKNKSFVKVGDIYEFSAWIRKNDECTSWLSFETFDKNGAYIGGIKAVQIQKSNIWINVKTRILINGNIGQIQPIIMGVGNGLTEIDKVELTLIGYEECNIPANMLSIENQTLRVDYNASSDLFSVQDKRSDKTWSQYINERSYGLTNAKVIENEIQLSYYIYDSGTIFNANISLDGSSPELVITLSGNGKMDDKLSFPMPFKSDVGMDVLIPAQEGLSLPVDDRTIPQWAYRFYSGNELSMGYFGVTNGSMGYMGIVETRNDAALQIWRRSNDLLAPQLYWEPEKGAFGYERKARYIFFSEGGFLAICKRYREYAKEVGFYKTLLEKKKENINTEKLVGSASIWYLGKTFLVPDPVDWQSEKAALYIFKQMKALGMDKVLWSSGGTKFLIKNLNSAGALTGIYDLYGGVWQKSSGWSKERNEEWQSGMVKDVNKEAIVHSDFATGKEIMAGFLCDKLQLKYAKKDITAELKAVPYRARFLDTTACDEWRECYDTNHPTTRTESRELRINLTKYTSSDKRQITGSETGNDTLVPYLHYIEGIMSIAVGCSPSSDIHKIISDTDEVQFDQYQFNYKYRLPMWELVYHDCVVSNWWWGENNNSILSYWYKKDLWDILYGASPMYAFDDKLWNKEEKRFVQSYKRVTRVTQAVGYQEMTGFCYLTSDRSVQMASYANGIKVIVNLGNSRYYDADGDYIGPLDYKTYGIN